MPDDLISKPNYSAWVYDPHRDVIHITTSDGWLYGWSLATSTFSPGVQIGGRLTSVDISPDGRFLIAGNADRVTTSDPLAFEPTYADQLFRVDLATGAVKKIEVAVTSTDQGVQDVAIDADGFVLFTINGAGWAPVQTFQVASDSPTISPLVGLGQATRFTSFEVSETRRFIGIGEGNISSGPLHLYSASADRVTADTDLYKVATTGGYNSGQLAVSEARGLVVDILYNNLYVLDLALNPVVNLSSFTASGRVTGAEFTEDGSRLLLWRGAERQILVIDTTTWQQASAFYVNTATGSGYNNAPYGGMDVARGGTALILDTGAGLEVVNLAAKLNGGLNQTLTGGAGQDSLAGGIGDDTISGGDGRNTMFGGDGADRIIGGSDFNQVNGNKGDDTISGASEVGDWLLGGQGNDVVDASASSGRNIVNGNIGADTLTGGSGADTLRGGQGEDTLTGGMGADWLSGDRGADTIVGGAGADIFYSFADAGVDRVLDFRANEGDRIQLEKGTAFLIRQVGPDTVISMNSGNEIWLVGVNSTTLAGGWIFSD